MNKKNYFYKKKLMSKTIFQNKKIGFRIKTDLESGIKSTIEWYLKEGKSFSKNKYNSFKEN